MAQPQFCIEAVKNLPLARKLDLVTFNAQSVSETIYMILDMAVELARNAAMETSPAKKAERDALMDVAYAAQGLAKDFRAAVQFIVEEQFAETKTLAAEKLSKEQAFIERIVTSQ